ncbi:RHS repeat domain-containing protein, partial [Deminuibacter soli]
KLFELTNHLGNVLATVSDRRQLVSLNNTTIDHYEPVLLSATDYYPFGMEMPGRVYSGGKYRYGFNGKENDNEVKGEGNQQDYGMRIYAPRLGRFLSVDPLSPKYPELTPYQFASNRPIDGIDQDGLEYAQAGQGKYGTIDGTAVMGIYPFHPADMVQKNAHIHDVAQKILTQQKAALFSYLALKDRASVGPTPYYTDAQLHAHESQRQADYDYQGKDQNGNDKPGTRLMNNRHFQGLANNVVIPVLEQAAGEKIGGLALKGISKLANSSFVTLPKPPVQAAVTTVEDASPSAVARSWQGKGDYPGIDDYIDVTLKKGSFVYGGLPGPSNYFTSATAVIGANGEKEALWKGLQVLKNEQFGYRPTMGVYVLKADTKAAFGYTLANPQLGQGGLPQYFIPNWEQVLKQITTIPLK